ncbi:hypothetical protein NBT05_18150 [Aquimarina sp. ERC-38]|uniref:hypothetical protein n=1 Tax=Aquimarina sp. ERC-38 TaxID=2949996 RepID=UPI0022464D4A|nr:hypothetical protein [Aquimarina sp. ERC-38]UZO80848.1 hypothetical protein NBT05_18150 [Aquimarina sp. ERC-38]
MSNAENKSLETKRKKVEKWLMEKNRFYNKTAFEQELGLPKGVVQKFVKYNKPFHDKHVDPLYSMIKRMTTFSSR